ncbi:MAG: LPS export ABC transporter periplasmic protein LptC [Rhizobiaceae bacterium]
MTIDSDKASPRPQMPAGRSDEIFDRARKHSRRVGLLKVGLPAGTLLLVVMFAGWAWLATPEGFTANVTGSAISDGKLVMANPKLNGFTKDDLPYTMTADRAVQDLSNPSIITLENIAARLPLEEKNWADIDAETGVFDNEKNTLDVTSPMNIRTTSGLLAELKSAFVDMNSGGITSKEPVRVSMDGSTLVADRMSVVDRGSIIVFENRVRMTVLPDRMKSADRKQE